MRKKKQGPISLHNRFSLYNFTTAIVPVVLSIFTTATLMIALVHLVYTNGDENARITNSRDIIGFYYCQINIKLIENYTDTGDINTNTKRREERCHSLEKRGFSVQIRNGDNIIYQTEGTDNNFFDTEFLGLSGAGENCSVLSDNICYINDISTRNNGSTLSITVVDDGDHIPTATGVTKFWNISNRTLIGVIVFILAFVIYFDIHVVRKLTKTIMEPIDSLTDAAKRIKKGNLNEPVRIDNRTQELSQLCSSFEEMRVELKNSNESKKEYENARRNTYSGLNHDARTAVTAIKGYSQGLIDGIANTPEKKQRYLEAIQNSAISLEKLLNSYSDVTNLETDSVVFNFQKKDMYSLLTEWYEDSREGMYERGIILTFDYKAKLRAFCKIDNFQMERIVDNVMSNCLKYKKTDSEFAEVCLTADIDSTGRYFITTYSDKGIGIDEKDAEKIFDIFYRADEARSNTQNGNGIGLSIVKQIILRHGGTISASGEKGKGLSVTMTLPITDLKEI